MSKEDECRQELADIKRLLYGDPSTGKGGLAHTVQTIGDTVYGPPHAPGGLVNDVAEIKRTIWIATGIVTCLQCLMPIVGPLIAKLVH